jgi:hypothetical protein
VAVVDHDQHPARELLSRLVIKGVHSKKIAELMGHSTTRTAESWYARVRGEDLGDVAELVADPSKVLAEFPFRVGP